MTRAFVLSGGASLGAVQVGMLRALGEAGVAPDLVVGTSVGAVNGAWLAGRPGPPQVEELETIWRGLRRADVFPLPPLRGVLGFLGRSTHLVPAAGLRALLARHLRFAHLEDAPVPLRVVACEVTTGSEVLLGTGDAVDAVAASAAIPGVFPPVLVDGRLLMDGGVANNAPVSHAIELGADEVWVLPTGYACAAPAPVSALGMAVQAITVLVHQRLAIDVQRYRDRCPIHVVPPLCPVAVSPVDFRRGAELIERAHAATSAWLHAGPQHDDGQQLVPHHHAGG
jgi:NTE family protein